MVYLGTIVTVANAVVDNTTTSGTTFTIPPYWPRVMLITPADGSGLGFNVRVTVGAVATSSDYSVAGSTAQQVECPKGYGGNTVVSISTPAGGTAGNVRVIGLYGQAQS